MKMTRMADVTIHDLPRTRASDLVMEEKKSSDHSERAESQGPRPYRHLCYARLNMKDVARALQVQEERIPSSTVRKP
jgi:hypothetical protein